MPYPTWDAYFMAMCETAGAHSKCLSRSVGAVLVREKSIVSTGYNGPPRGIPACNLRNRHREMTCPRRLAGFASGEGMELCMAAHAEPNCLVNAARLGVAVENCVLYVSSAMPCGDCMKLIINAGISEVVYHPEHSGKNVGGKFYDRKGRYLIRKSGVLVRPADMG